jgi:antitoxin VapB
MAMSGGRHVRLFRNGRNQAVRIPVEFELPGEEAIMRQDGDKLVIEPVRKRGLIAVLDSLETLDEAFPDVDEGLLPLPDVKL